MNREELIEKLKVICEEYCDKAFDHLNNGEENLFRVNICKSYSIEQAINILEEEKMNIYEIQVYLPNENKWAHVNSASNKSDAEFYKAEWENKGFKVKIVRVIK